MFEPLDLKKGFPVPPNGQEADNYRVAGGSPSQRIAEPKPVSTLTRRLGSRPLASDVNSDALMIRRYSWRVVVVSTSCLAYPHCIYMCVPTSASKI